MGKKQEKVNAVDLDYISDSKAAFLEEKMPYAYLVLATVIIFVVAIIGWASIAEVSEVTRGNGKVIPSASTQVIQSLEGGILSELHASEGQTVNKGDVLLRIDDTAFAANYKENLAQRDTLLAIVARLEAETSGSDSIVFPVEIIEKRPDLVVAESLLFNTRRTNLLDNERHLSVSLDLKRKELEITEPLAESGIVSQVDVLRLETSVNDVEGKLLKIRADFMNEVVAKRNESRAQLEQLEQSIRAYEDKVRRTVIKSPVYGTINKIHITTVGGVIRSGEPIIEIVPLDGTLLVEANINPKDIAFIRPHQTATVKLTAYDYSIYGGLEGTVERISADTFSDEKGNSFYQIKVRTGERSLKTNSDDLQIMPGMVVEVDILTGRKTILDYLLKPLLRAKMNSFTER